MKLRSWELTKCAEVAWLRLAVPCMHESLMGDKTHPYSKEVFLKLEEINRVCSQAKNRRSVI
jgi:hypothetical protein